jgi:hypothetical protein
MKTKFKMGISRIKRYLKDSIKVIEIGKILNFLSMNNSTIAPKVNTMELEIEIEQELVINENKDFMLLSKNETFRKIRELLDAKKVVVCNCHDRDGVIGLKIVEAINNFREESFEIVLRDDQKFHLYDKFLYNLLYDIKKRHYSLEEHDEYYEKISIRNED